MSRQGKKRAGTLSNIKSFWEAEAKEIGKTPQVTIRDFYFRIHELHTLLSLIPKCSSLLDAGCGTGFGTLLLSRKADLISGFDYSGEMIHWAKRLQKNAVYRRKAMRELSPLWPVDPSPESRIIFSVDDILKLKLSEKHFFDVITGQRILINLPTDAHQMTALENLRKHCRPGGKLFLVEATQQGHARTDRLRRRFNLPILEKYWHNHYVNENLFSRWTRCGWKIEKPLTFDTYFLLSKLVYPASRGEKNCHFLSGANRAAMETANLFRTQQAAEEIGGTRGLLEFYGERVRLYDKNEGSAILNWIRRARITPSDWNGIGHQKLIIAKAV